MYLVITHDRCYNCGAQASRYTDANPPYHAAHTDIPQHALLHVSVPSIIIDGDEWGEEKRFTSVQNRK